MTVKQIDNKISEYLKLNKKIFISSSFQTHSIPLLHILSQITSEIDVLFINTGFHFPETISFKNQVAELLGINVIDVSSIVPKINQQDAEGQFYFASDPDRCCFLNKTQPLEPYLQEYDIWISGVRADQNANRQKMKIEQESSFNTLRFHPILDWTSKDIYGYRIKFDLPEHPLDKLGYSSIGCKPCTSNYALTDQRSARWFGLSKTECGLHTELVK